MEALKYNPKVIDPLPFVTEEVTSLAPANSSIDTTSKVNQTTEIRGINECEEVEQEPVAPGSKPFTFFYRNNNAYQYHQLNGWDTYPKSTSVHCWWDSHSFTQQPIGLPVKRDDKTNVYHCIGCFCSANCALAYANHTKMNATLLNQLYSEMESVIELTSAPHFSTLAIFGGNFDITEFRNKSTSQWKDYVAPMVPWAVISEERVKNSIVKPKPSPNNKEKLSKLRSVSRT